MVLLSQNISLRESALLTIGTSLVLILAHYFFGVIGLVGALCLGVVVLLTPSLQSRKGSFILVYFVASIFILDKYEGIQPIEIPFLVLSVFLLLFVAFKIINGSIVLENSLDYLFLLFHFLIPYAIILGIVNGAPLYSTLSDIKFFLGIFTYFPLREHLQNNSFKKALAVIVLLILSFVLIRNFVYYQQLIAQALVQWEAESARVAANELILVLGFSLSLSIAAITNTKRLQFFAIVSFIAFTAGIILTQSRGYWLASFISVVAIFFLINRRGKLRISFTALLFFIGGLIIANIFFGNFLSLVINGLTERFQSFGSISADNSLNDRWRESKSVFELIKLNPIAGYGFGSQFTRKVLFFDFFIKTSYVHNGYLAMIFKFGVLGLATIIFIWGSILYKSIRLYKKAKNSYLEILSLTFFGTVAGMFIVNITSPQVLTFEGLLVTSTIAAFLNSQKHE